jgi:hypothetical protein
MRRIVALHCDPGNMTKWNQKAEGFLAAALEVKSRKSGVWDGRKSKRLGGE